VHRGEYVFDQDATNRIGISNLARLHKSYAEGGLVGGSPSWIGAGAATPIAPASGPQGVHVSVGVSVDDDGKLQAVVKSVSTRAANQALTDYVSSDAAILNHANAHSAAKMRTMV
jgi:hypothetical protein